MPDDEVPREGGGAQPQMSADGKWWWTGTEWVSAESAVGRGAGTAREVLPNETAAAASEPRQSTPSAGPTPQPGFAIGRKVPAQGNSISLGSLVRLLIVAVIGIATYASVTSSANKAADSISSDASSQNAQAQSAPQQTVVYTQATMEASLESSRRLAEIEGLLAATLAVGVVSLARRHGPA